jgi:type I restriction enzyme S subunit
MSLGTFTEIRAVRAHGLSRWDVNFSLQAGRSVDEVPRRPLGELLASIKYGTSARATADGEGVPVLRMGNIQDGAWDLRDLKYIEMSPRDFQRFAVEPGDVLVNRTNTEELVGKAAAWQALGEWTFASYLIRLRVDPAELNPEFLAAWINSPDARRQIDKFKRRSAGMTNINTTDIRGLLVPQPPLPEQEQLVATLVDAHARREELLRASAKTLLEVRSTISAALGQESVPLRTETIYSTSMQTVSASTRLDVGYYFPSRLDAIDVVESGEWQQVRDLCQIVRAPSSGAVLGWGLGSVEGQTGRRVKNAQPESMSGALRYQAGDVLYARLRPALNKVWAADSAGVCSPEFRVLRPHEGIDASGLAALLRCWFVVEQTRWATTGNTHPRLSDDDLLDVRVPLVGDLRAIGELYERAAVAATTLEAEASQTWAAAKASFAESLGGF